MRLIRVCKIISYTLTVCLPEIPKAVQSKLGKIRNSHRKESRSTLKEINALTICYALDSRIDQRRMFIEQLLSIPVKTYLIFSAFCRTEIKQYYEMLVIFLILSKFRLSCFEVTRKQNLNQQIKQFLHVNKIIWSGFVMVKDFSTYMRHALPLKSRRSARI